MSILGQHTVDETRDYLAVADYRFKETGKAYDALKERPQDLITDWTALKTRWDIDRKKVAGGLTELLVRHFPLPARMIPSEGYWKVLVDYLEYQELDPKSLQGITRRIEALSKKSILYPNQPTPESLKTDFDLDLFKDLDAGIKAGEQGAAQAKKKAGETADSKWPWIIGGTVIATVAGLAAAKVYLGK